MSAGTLFDIPSSAGEQPTPRRRTLGSAQTRILVTGSRHWSDLETMVDAFIDVWRSLGRPLRPLLVHGACTGADSMAAQLWRLWGWPVEAHPADWEQHGAAAGPPRNAEMVESGADICVAFPLPDSRGTWDCVARATDAGIAVRVVDPPGEQTP